MPFEIFLLANRMTAVGIDHHLKLLVESYQPVDQLFSVLKMNIIIAGSVNDQQITFKTTSMGDG